ncbi:hypothetical protein [Peribacillus butanolivorans]|nr:hypothetical protein [Peribacillus butanolivorans]
MRNRRIRSRRTFIRLLKESQLLRSSIIDQHIEFLRKVRNSIK